MLERTDLAEAAEWAARQLVAVEHGARRSVIQTPLMLPSGSMVGIRVSADGPGFSVSDGGVAFDEAKLNRATRAFGNHSPAVAADAGVSFDGQAFFLQRVTHDRLVGAVLAVANVSQTAAILANHRQAVLEARDAEDRLVARLSRIFGHVDVRASVVGASGTPWEVDAVVHADSRVILFESVLARKQSIYAAVAKFHDIARLTDAPSRVAAVHSRDDLGSMLGVISQAANVVEDETPDRTIAQLALAA